MTVPLAAPQVASHTATHDPAETDRDFRQFVHLAMVLCDAAAGGIVLTRSSSTQLEAEIGPTAGADVATRFEGANGRLEELRTGALVLTHGDMVLLDDAFAVAETSARFQNPPFRSYAGVAIRDADGAVLGALWVGSARTAGLRSVHLAHLTTVADQAATHLALRCATEDLRLHVRLQEATEDRLRASEQRYRELATQAPVPLLVHIQGRIVFANAQAAALLGGISPSQLLGVTITDLVAPEEVAHVRARLARLEDGKPVDGERQEIRKNDGTTAIVELHGRRILYDGVVAAQVQMLDITARVVAEDALRRSEERFRVLYDKAPVGQGECDLDGILLSANEALAAMTGYTVHELVGRPIVTLLHPDDRANFASNLAATREGTVERATSRRRYVHRDGREVPVLVSTGLRRDRHGAPDGMLALVLDLSDQVHATARLEHADTAMRQLLQTAADAFVATDDQGRILRWNRAAEHLFGWKSSEALGRDLALLLIPERFRRAHRAGVAHFLETGEGPVFGNRVELVALHQSGKEVPIELSVWSTREGDQWQFNAFLHDIGPRLQARAELVGAHEELAGRQEFTEAVLAAVDVGIIACDGEGAITVSNRATREFHGFPLSVGLDRAGAPLEQWSNRFDLFTPDGLSRVEAKDIPLVRALRGEDVHGVEIVIAAHGRPKRLVVCHGRRLEGHAGQPLGAVVAMHDVTAQRAAENALRASEERFRATFDSSPAGMTLSNESGELAQANGAFCSMLGKTPEVLLGRSMDALTHPEDLPRVLELASAIRAGHRATGSVELRFLREDHAVRWTLLTLAPVTGPDGEHWLLGQSEDITRRRAGEHALRHDALHDVLTGLPNRRLLLDHLTRASARARRRRQSFTLMFCDLDAFKPINDRWGHSVGDAVLIEVGRRLTAAMRTEDVVARIGGDEFALLAEGVTPDVAKILEERVRATVEQPITVDGETVHVGVSVGLVASFGDLRPAQLLDDADRHMYEAKRSRRAGQNGVV